MDIIVHCEAIPDCATSQRCYLPSALHASLKNMCQFSQRSIRACYILSPNGEALNECIFHRNQKCAYFMEIIPFRHISPLSIVISEGVLVNRQTHNVFMEVSKSQSHSGMRLNEEGKRRVGWHWMNQKRKRWNQIRYWRVWLIGLLCCNREWFWNEVKFSGDSNEPQEIVSESSMY